MKKSVFWVSMVLAIVIMFGTNNSLATGCEVLGDALISISKIRSYEWNNIEEMVCDFPNATIPYRGSDMINSLNNSVICCGTERGVGIRKFVQTNNVFPIIWSTEFFIGMNYVDLMGTIKNWNDTSDALIVEYINDEDIQIVLCSYYGGLIDKDVFALRFYVFDDQVYQIEFEFLTN